METFASRRRRTLNDVLGGGMSNAPNAQTPDWAKIWGATPFGQFTNFGNQAFGQLRNLFSGQAMAAQGQSPIQKQPMMGFGMNNPSQSMGGPQQSSPFMAPLASMGAGQAMSKPDVSREIQPPMPPQAPGAAMGAPMQLAGATPSATPMGGDDTPFASNNPADYAAFIRGFNGQAAAGNPQQYADQYAAGDLNNIRARTYRNEDGTSWNDYFKA